MRTHTHCYTYTHSSAKSGENTEQATFPTTQKISMKDNVKPVQYTYFTAFAFCPYGAWDEE